MAKTERCPICNVSVKSENLLRHVDDNHPRHPASASLRERLRREPQYQPIRPRSEGIRLRKWHATVLVGVVLAGVGGYVAWPYLFPPIDLARVCLSGTQAYHWHPRLSIIVDGSRYPIPYNIGIEANCLRPLHTHDARPPDPQGYIPESDPAVLHVEPPVRMDATLGDFFRVWGKTLTETRVAECVGSLTMTVDGRPSTAFGGHVFADGQLIEIRCTRPA